MGSSPVDPINPQQTDAAAGSVYTGERRTVMRWTPKWGGKLSLLEALIVLVVLLGTGAVLALWLVF